jgi:hypothetical protein
MHDAALRDGGIEFVMRCRDFVESDKIEVRVTF